MKLSKKSNYLLFILLLTLNVILRLQVVPREIGRDSFEMHIMANSISEFGYAKWFLDPLSIIGLYPASYTSAMQFLLSGIHQCANIEMTTVIYIYCIILGLISVFASYIMAKIFFENDTFTFLAAFLFSTSTAILTYTTWTIPTRGLFIVLAPVALYLAIKTIDKLQIKNILMLVIFSLFLFSTHHLFYFILPMYISAIIIILGKRRKQLFLFLSIKDPLILKNKNLLKYSTSLIPLIGFLLMFSIPFITGKFIVTSRYAPVYISYIRYLSVLVIFAFGGLLYLIFKNKKNNHDWFILVSAIFLTALIYQETYMKCFIIIIAVFFSSIGLFNFLNIPLKKIYISSFLILFLLSHVAVSGYYQFLHDYGNEGSTRYIEDSTYNTGKWIKYSINGSCISNDLMSTDRIFSISDTVHFLGASTTNNQIYGFTNVNISQYEFYPIKSDNFWLSGYKGPDIGESTWHAVHMLWQSPYDYNITHVVENTKTNGYIVWGHGPKKSNLLESVYKNDQIYDIGTYRIWSITTSK